VQLAMMAVEFTACCTRCWSSGRMIENYSIRQAVK